MSMAMNYNMELVPGTWYDIALKATTEHAPKNITEK